MRRVSSHTIKEEWALRMQREKGPSFILNYPYSRILADSWNRLLWKQLQAWKWMNRIESIIPSWKNIQWWWSKILPNCEVIWKKRWVIILPVYMLPRMGKRDWNRSKTDCRILSSVMSWCPGWMGLNFAGKWRLIWISAIFLLSYWPPIIILRICIPVIRLERTPFCRNLSK